MLNVYGWTDGRTDVRTNVRKLARLCLPAKAGATKTADGVTVLNLYCFIFVPSFKKISQRASQLLSRCDMHSEIYIKKCRWS